MQGQVRIDVRQLSAESRVMLRQYVLCIKQHSRRITQRKIARACGVSQPSVSRWLRAPQEFQVEIPPIIARRAAKKSAGKGLSFAQEARLKELVAGQPDQLALPGLRWSRRDLIVVTQRLFGITIDSHLAAAYLERWGVEPKAPSGQDLEADIIRFLEDHSTDWLKVSEIAQGVGCSMQRANSALMALAEAGGCRAEMSEEYDSKYRLRVKTLYRANQADTSCELARLLGMVAVQPVGGRVVRGRAMHD